MDRLPSRDVVLIGAGHTNLHVVRMWRMGAIPDARLTLVTPFARATYSGMLPGTLAGLYRPEEMEIDLYRFTASCGVRLIVAEAVGLDAKQHRVLVADRPPVRYDVASVGIGSVPARRDLWESCPRVLSIKPMATFCDRLERALSDARQLLTPPGDAGPPPVRVAVVGAGAGGTEVTFSLDAWLRSRGVPAQVTLVDSGEEVLPGYSAGAIQRVRREMARRGIALRLGDRVTQIVDAPGQPMQLQFARQSALAADFVIWGTTAAAPPALQNFQLPKSDDGFLTVRPTLQTTGPFPVFAVGDSACFVESPLPKAGVYAVREGPVLWDNLQRLLAGRELRPYVPQRGFLSLLATGDGRAVMQYRGWAGHGRWAWQWKDHIDRKFMRMYQDYSPPPQMPASIRAGNAPAGRADGHVGRGSGAMAPPMRCHGCGSKVGANILAEALGRLSISPDARTRLALDRPDDAAILDRRAAPVDVLSIDFFPAFLDDPYLVGRVAALNALSDLWAMGSQPLGALALVTLPEGEPSPQTELLYQVLAGGVRELTAAGAQLWGGHTTQGAELTIGYSVAGRLDDAPPFTKGNLQPGDRLILTKPLGTGTLLAANRLGRCQGRWMEGMLSRMLQGNGEAARLAREFAVTAATDVTGFGLAGHLLEMLDASRMSASLALGAIPLLEGFASLCQEFPSSLAAANRGSETRLKVATSSLCDEPPFQALFDPQTSGGLLIAAAADRATALRDALAAQGLSSAIIGSVGPFREGPSLDITS